MRLSTIKSLYGGPGPWASVYLDATGTHESGTPLAARRALDLRWRSRREELAAAGADEATLRAIDEAVVAAPATGRPATVAVLAHDGVVALSRMLPVAPARERASWSAQPHVADLLRALDAAETAGAPAPGSPHAPGVHDDLGHLGGGVRWVRAEVDRTGGTVDSHDGHTVRLHGEDEFIRRVSSDARDRMRSQDKKQRAAQENWDENSEQVARAVAAAAARSGADVVILAGDVRARELVLDHLPKPLASRVVQIEHEVPVRPHPDSYLHERREPDVFDATLEQASHEAIGLVARDRRAAIVEKFHNGLSWGESVRGVEAVSDAARRLNIATLVLTAEPSHQQVWVDPLHPTVVGRSQRVTGSHSAVAEPADDALVGAAAMSGADSIVVEADPELIDGLGAILRYPDPQAARIPPRGSHEDRTGGPIVG